MEATKIKRTNEANKQRRNNKRKKAQHNRKKGKQIAKERHSQTKQNK
jgi:hypothetical protein